MQLEVGKSFHAFLRRRKTEGLRLPVPACFLCVQTSTRKTVGEIYNNTENEKSFPLQKVYLNVLDLLIFK